MCRDCFVPRNDVLVKGGKRTTKLLISNQLTSNSLIDKPTTIFYINLQIG